MGRGFLINNNKKMSAIPLNESVPIIKGLNLTNKQLKEAFLSNKMLLIDAETSNICNLNCEYCFRDVYGTKSAIKNELSIKERKDLFKQACELGCRTIKISGAGEPSIDPYFEEMVKYANDLGMWVISFTNGFVIDEKRAKELSKLGLSLIVKCNSFDPKIEDKMVGRQGYAEKRNKALNCLISAGFTKDKPTRLGMDAVITKLNIDIIINSLRYCRQNNIFPIFRPMMPIGGARDKEEWQITKEETIKLYEKARDLDKKEFDIEYDLALPYMGGTWCRQLNYALYINILGEVYSCTGSKKCFGNIRDKKLKEIWNSSDVQKVRNTPYDSCPMREKYWRGEKNYDCV